MDEKHELWVGPTISKYVQTIVASAPDAIVTFKTEHYADKLRRMLEKDLPHTSFNVARKKVFISGLEPVNLYNNVGRNYDNNWYKV